MAHESQIQNDNNDYYYYYYYYFVTKMGHWPIFIARGWTDKLNAFVKVRSH